MLELTKLFKHFARDLFIYFLTGFVVVVNLAYLDYRFNAAATLNYIIDIPYWTIGLIITTYVFGHLIFSLMYVFVEYPKLEDWMKRKFFPIENNSETAFNIDSIREISIFQNRTVAHDQFIERHTQLYLLRWNLAGGFLFSGLLDLVFGIEFHFTCFYGLLIIALIFIGCVVYILSLKTEKDCYDRVNNIYATI